MKKEERYLFSLTRIYLLFITAVYPLYVGLKGYDDIVASKARLYWAASLTFIAIFSLFYAAYLLGKTGQNKDPNHIKLWQRINASDYALIAFLFIITLSCIFSEYQDIVWLGWPNRQDGWLSYFCMIIGFFIISRWYKPQSLDFTVMAISSSVVCIIGFLQYYGYDFLKLFPYHAKAYALDRIEGNKSIYSGFTIIFRSTLGNINFVGIYVCMAIILFGILYVKTDTKLSFLYLAASVMNFALMIIAESDSGKVAVLSVFVLLIPYWIIHKKDFGKLFILISGYGITYFLHFGILINIIFPSWDETLSPYDEKARPIYDIRFKQGFISPPIYTILIVAVICLAIGLALLYLKNKAWFSLKTAKKIGVGVLAVLIIGGFTGVEVLGKRLPETNIIHHAREILHGNFDDSFGTNRLFIWKRAIDRVPHIPALGTGSDTFYYAFGKVNQTEGLEKYKVIYDKAHNDFIQILLCNGFFALAAYLVFLISLVVLSIKKAFSDTLLLMGFGTSLAYVVQSFFGIDTVIVTPLFWLFMGIVRGRENSQV